MQYKDLVNVYEKIDCTTKRLEKTYFISEIIDPISGIEDEDDITFTIIPEDLDVDDILTVSSIYNTSFFENITVDPISSQSNVERNITLNPINNKFGNSTIILNISDGQTSNYIQVPVNISSVNSIIFNFVCGLPLLLSKNTLSDNSLISIMSSSFIIE